MNWTLHLSPEAERGIEDQMRWYEANEKHGGPELANRWLDRLQPALDNLCTHPERHGFAPENGRWHPELALRQMLFKPWKTKSAWRILYSLNEKKHVLTVIQIRHERRPPLFDIP